jgi:hypothetical protein
MVTALRLRTQRADRAIEPPGSRRALKKAYCRPTDMVAYRSLPVSSRPIGMQIDYRLFRLHSCSLIIECVEDTLQKVWLGKSDTRNT